MPPPSLAELPDTVVSVTVAVPLFQMPPPEPNVAKLPENVLPLTVSVPELAIPPPSKPFARTELLDSLQPLTVSVAPTSLEMPPPALEAVLSERVQLLTVSAPWL